MKDYLVSVTSLSQSTIRRETINCLDLWVLVFMFQIAIHGGFLMQLDESPHRQEQVEVLNGTYALSYSCSSVFWLRKLKSFLSIIRRMHVKWVPSLLTAPEQLSWQPSRARGESAAGIVLLTAFFLSLPSLLSSFSSSFPPSLSLPQGEQMFELIVCKYSEGRELLPEFTLPISSSTLKW